MNKPFPMCMNYRVHEAGTCGGTMCLGWSAAEKMTREILEHCEALALIRYTLERAEVKPRLEVHPRTSVELTGVMVRYAPVEMFVAGQTGATVSDVLSIPVQVRDDLPEGSWRIVVASGAMFCEGLCGCRYGTDDPDTRECGCTGPCAQGGEKWYGKEATRH